MNHDYEEDKVMEVKDAGRLFAGNFFLGSKKMVQNRRTYAIFAFLGDAGGIY